MADYVARFAVFPDLLFITADPVDFVAFFVPPMGTSDAAAPTATLVSPLDHAVARNTPIVIDVADESLLSAAIVWCEYADGTNEIAYADGAFFPRFASTSTATVIVAELQTRLSILPFDGWSKIPTVHVSAIDAAGNVL